MTWTQAKIAQLKKLWKEGTVATEIGKLLGTSKNSVIAKAHRLHCAPRKSGRLNSAPRKFHTSPTQTRVTRKEVLQAILREMEPENPTSLENLTDNQCRFPLGEEEEAPTFFCGRQPWAGSRKHAPNYCKYHVYVATKIDDPRKAIQP